MATGRLPDPNSAPVTAKGDLYTYSTRPERLAVGSDGDTLVADSSASTGLRYNPMVNQNFAINGGFDWWQRGTSFTGTSPYYTADRWQGYRDAGVSGSTFSRQTSGLDGFQYCIRAQRDSGNATSNQLNVAQSFETNDIRKLWGNYATVSFWARKGANYSPSSSDVTARLFSGTGTETSVASGFTSGTVIGSTAAVLTTSWQRFSFTTSAVVANTATQLSIGFLSGSLVGTAGANDYFEITGVQLEIGQTATAWKRAGGTLAGEFEAACRYYWRITKNDGIVGHMYKYLSGDGMGFIELPVPMRVTPTSMDILNIQFQQTNLTNNAIVGPTLNTGYSTNKIGAFTFGQTGLASGTQGYAALTSSGYIGFSAEL